MDFESLKFGSAITRADPACCIASVLERQVRYLLKSAETQQAQTEKMHQEVESLKQRIAALESEKR